MLDFHAVIGHSTKVRRAVCVRKIGIKRIERVRWPYTDNAPGKRDLLALILILGRRDVHDLFRFSGRELTVPEGNRRAEQPKIPGASVRRTARRPHHLRRQIREDHAYS